MDDPDTGMEPVELDVSSHPHRSMGRGGLRYLLWFILGLNLVGSCVFISLGAWPVAGFLGLVFPVETVFLENRPSIGRNGMWVLGMGNSR
jgi:uncharacterized membrane protein